jgi:hypothetical protein
MSLYNIERLPKDVQLEYLKELSAIDLLNLYNTNNYFNKLLKNEDTIKSLINYYGLNNNQPKITTLMELIIGLLPRLTPKEIYCFHLMFYIIVIHLLNHT